MAEQDRSSSSWVPSPGATAPDLAEVLSDDALVEAVGKGEISTSNAPDDVVALLVAWREDIDRQPMLDRPTLAEAERALQGAPRRSWRLTRRTVAPLAAASVVGLALVGIGVGAHESTPGDPLWGVSQTLFVAHSRSVQAAVSVNADLSQAQADLDAGSAAKAMVSLDEAKRQLTDVGSAEGRQALELKHSELVAQAGARLGTTADDPTTPAQSPGSASTSAAPSAQPSPDTSAAGTGSPETSAAATTTTAPTRTADAPPTSSSAPTTSAAPTSSAAPTTSSAPTTSAAPTSSAAPTTSSAPTTSAAPTTGAAPTTSAAPNTTAGANPASTPAGGPGRVPTVTPVGAATGGVPGRLGAVLPR